LDTKCQHPAHLPGSRPWIWHPWYCGSKRLCCYCLWT